MIRRVLLAFALAGGCATHEQAPEPEPEPAQEAPQHRIALGAMVQAELEAAAAAVPYIPAEATFVVWFDFDQLATNPSAVAVWDELLRRDDDDEMREIMDAFSSCGLTASDVDELILAGNGDEFAFTAFGDGVGNPEVYRCMAKRDRDKSDDDPMEVIEENGLIKLVSKDSTGVLPSHSVMYVAGGKWGKSLPERFGPGASPLNDPSPALAELVETVGGQEPIRWAAIIPKDQLFNGIVSATGSMSGEGPLEFEVALQAKSEPERESTQKMIEAQWSSVKSIMAGYIPQSIVDSVTFSGKGDTIAIGAEASHEDISSLLAKIPK